MMLSGALFEEEDVAALEAAVAEVNLQDGNIAHAQHESAKLTSLPTSPQRRTAS